MWRVLVVMMMGCGFAPGQPNPIDSDRLDAAHDAPPDAPIDVAPVTCPDDFDFAIGTSRYQVVTTNRNYWTQHMLCAAAQPGSTHLAVLDSDDEAVTLRQHLMMLTTQPSGMRYYVGVVQDPTASAVGDGWIHFTGGTVAQPLWSNFGTNGVEPDDNGDSDEDREEQIACLDLTVSTGYLVDLAGGGTAGAVCECDGQALHPTAAKYLAEDPNHPPP